MKSRMLLAILILVFTWTLFGPAEVFARYHDGSGDLPGMDDSATTTLLVVAGIVLTGVLVYILVKRSGDDDVANEDAKKSEAQLSEKEPGVTARRSAGDDPLRTGSEAFDRQGLGESRESKVSVDPVILVKRDGGGAGLVFTF